MAAGQDLVEILKQVPAIPGYVLTRYQLLRWGWQRYTTRRHAHRVRAPELIDHRVRIREEIERKLQRYEPRPGARPDEPGRYEDIVVHDISRVDAYPKLDPEGPDGVGISPWMKLEVNGLYHRGIEVFLSLGRQVVPVEDEDGLLGGWRFLRKDEPQEEGIYALPVARIPFDFIERIDWSQDEYGDGPHFYCRYASRLREPYAEVVYKAKLYPNVSETYHELEGLRLAAYSWGFLRCRWFLFRQDTRRLWRRLRRKRSIRKNVLPS
jgi:hypothetical protein